MEWSSNMDEAPRDGTEFLAYWSHNSGMFKYIQPMKWLDGGFVITWDHDDKVTPTHWMPMPPPPDAD